MSLRDELCEEIRPLMPFYLALGARALLEEALDVMKSIQDATEREAYIGKELIHRAVAEAVAAMPTVGEA
jgi:hypothetical protein